MQKNNMDYMHDNGKRNWYLVTLILILLTLAMVVLLFIGSVSAQSRGLEFFSHILAFTGGLLTYFWFKALIEFIKYVKGNGNE